MYFTIKKLQQVYKNKIGNFNLLLCVECLNLVVMLMFDLPSWRLGGFCSLYPAYAGIINPTMCHKRALCFTNGVPERSHQTRTQEKGAAQ